MTAEQTDSLPPTARILVEILDQLQARGILTFKDASAAAVALDAELRNVDPFFERQGQAAAVLALRAADWPPPSDDAETPDDRAALALVAWEVEHLLATDDARHVADFLRHAEAGVGRPQQSVEALLPTATRAIAEYRRLTSANQVT